MSIITTMLRQTATWWAQGSVGRDGRVSFAEPVEIDCRWEGNQERFIDENGVERVSRAVVYVDHVNAKVAAGDYVKEAALDSATPSDPRDEAGAYPVRQVRTTPNLKATETLRECLL